MRPFLFAVAIASLLVSCASLGGAGTAAAGRERALLVVPSTLKVLREDGPGRTFAREVELDAARGEAESSQLLVYAGGTAMEDAVCEAVDLVGPGGFAITPELGVVGYVPLRKPSLVGFWRPGDYPDPILPLHPFDVAAGRNQSIWYTVWVPKSAPAGVYRGRVVVRAADGSSFEAPVTLRVHDVELPARSFLKTAIAFRGWSFNDDRYYGGTWTAERSAGLPLLGLKYRFTARVDLPLDRVFSTAADGSLVADWADFDGEVARWSALGTTCFEAKFGIDMEVAPSRIDAEFGPRLAALDRHLVEAGWAERFYFYFYDEPSARDMEGLRARLEAIRSHAPHIANILTYGPGSSGQRRLLGEVGIWVPNIHQYNPRFAAERRARGEEVWVYTCVANAFRVYPDNFRIDWYGAAHRALGWWLFKYGAQGYLYWSVDLWGRDPWKTTETFPWTNGDGMLFYPPPDRGMDPLPSIRVHLMRDAFEDYDLLTMLRNKYEARGTLPEEVSALLEAKGLVTAPDRFSHDDAAYVEAHRRLLELLEWAGS
jgi:hypothetical protein